jgi:uncharacterized protein (TIGR03435 family)
LAAQTFDVADVRVAPSASTYLRTAFLPNGRYEMKGATMLYLVSAAWSLEPEYVYGGPNWLDTDRFDIVAKAPPAATEAERQLMLRALLSDRFKLVTHEDKKPIEVFVLTAGKRAVAFQKSDGTVAAGCETTVDQTPPATVSFVCHNLTMAKLAEELRPRDRAAINHPVVDLTGLKGAWDFTLKYSPLQQLQRARVGANGPAAVTAGNSIFEALDKAGLKLELRKQPAQVRVVDSVNRAPSGNPAEVTKYLPPAPTEFEVADMKPSAPGTKPGGGFKPGGRIDIQGLPVKQLVGVAWNFDDEKMVVGAPKWMETEPYDLVAKATVGPNNEFPPEDELRLMLRSLLVDRFKLTTHVEDRPAEAFELLPGKKPHRMKPADPQSRSECKISLGQTGSGSAVIPLRILTCQNTTMAQFAEVIHVRAAAYVDHPVVDKTGIPGGWDFAVSWTGKGMLNAARNRTGEDGAAADPSGGMTVFESVDRQMGLRLEGGKKDPLPVLVIDHAEPLTPGN